MNGTYKNLIKTVNAAIFGKIAKIIVTDVGGLKEYVVENKTGFIVNPDEKDLSNKINYFFENKLFEEMSLFIKNYKEKFSWKNFEERINEK